MVAEHVPRLEPLSAVGALHVFDIAGDGVLRGKGYRIEHLLKIPAHGVPHAGIAGELDEQEGAVAARNADILRHPVIRIRAL